MVQIAKITFGWVAFALLCNRLLFVNDVYRRLQVERSTDVYMKKVCDAVDYRKIGRHAAICAEIDHRLSGSIQFHVAKAVVDDTMYRRPSSWDIAYVAIFASAVMTLTSLQSYVFRFEQEELPLYGASRKAKVL
jgi:hypothetical protein